MVRRIAELLLLIVAGFGGYRAWETGRERSRLEVIHDRLTRELGDLPVGDPAKVLFRAVETGEPLHFAWQVHLPANYAVNLKHSSGGFGSGTPSPNPRDFIARYRLGEDAEGRLQTYVKFAGGAGQFSLGDRRLSDLLRARSGEIIVERLGVAETAVIEPENSATVLRLTFPETMREEAMRALPGHFEGGKALVLFEMTLNPPPGKP